MGDAPIFSSRHRGVAPGVLWSLALAFVLAIVMACSFERGSGDGLVLLFGVPSLAFGALIGRWWAVLIPVSLTTVAVTAGVECSSSDQPQALMLAGTLVGVACRCLGDRLAGAS